MESLTPEQRDYKQRTLHQLMANQARLEASLAQETRPRVLRSIQKQLSDIEAHVSRLQDELAGDVLIDEPVADELFKKAAQALARGKFYLAKRQITKLETIEPFYPGIERMKQEAATQQVSRRTRSIAEGKASGYSSVFSAPEIPPPPTAGDAAAALPGESPAAPVDYGADEAEPWYRSLFQFHIMLSCLVVVLLLCVVFGMAGFTILQWLVEGGA